MFAEAVNQHRAGHNAEADALYRAVVAVQPIHSEAHYNLGLLMQTQNRLADAMTAYRNAIMIRPDYPDAHCNLGTVLQELRKFDEAVVAYQRAIAINANFAMAHCNLGVALKEQGSLDAAVTSFLTAIAIKKDYDWAYANLGAALMEQGKVHEAIAACRRAIAINADMVVAHFNLATAFKSLSLLDEAAAAFRQAITLRPDFAEGHFSLAQVLLLQGDLDAGWHEYEWRWKLKDYAWLRQIHGEFAQPAWAGEDLAGKTILIYCEQGMGDAIQFARYLPMVQRRGGKVIFAVHGPLMRLFEEVEALTVVPLDRPFPHFDVYYPLLSLPRIFGTRLDSIPTGLAYIHAVPAEVAVWRDRIVTDKLRVGVVWAGNPTQTGDHLRSPRLAAMAPIFEVAGVQFVSLQVGPGRDDLALLSLPEDVIDLGSAIKDFADTAAIVAGLDLLITSCTAPLHLAGALNIPTWALIPFAPHFAWLTGRADSPWYPSLRLYRQDAPGSDWSGPVGRIIADLEGITLSTG
jgi:tetratricopeptide (TPR) repeat protein